MPLFLQLKLNFWLKNGYSIDARDGKQRTPLHTCAAERKDGFFRLLLPYNPEIDAVDADGNTPLHLCSKRNHFLMVESLLSAGADPNAVNKDGRTPLHCNIDLDDELNQTDLLYFAITFNRFNREFMPPLDAVRPLGLDTSIVLLLKAGADPNRPDKRGETPADLCIAANNELALIYLVASGADIDRIPKRFPLVATLCLQGDAQRDAVEQILLEKKFDVNAPCRFGSPLHIACCIISFELVELLLSHGAEVNPRDPFHNIKDPLYWRYPLTQLLHGLGNDSLRDAILKLLIKNGAIIHWPETAEASMQPLGQAVTGNHEECAVTLVKHGASTAISIEGRSLARNARIRGMRKLSKLLRKLGATHSRRGPNSLFDLATQTTRRCLAKRANGASIMPEIEKIPSLALTGPALANLKLNEF